MFTKVTAATSLKLLVVTLLLAFIGATFVTPNVAYAKAGDVTFTGIVQAKPATGLQGSWTIGGKIFKTNAGTQFNQVNGPLVVGACAKVKIRSGAVKEIASELLGNCQ